MVDAGCFGGDAEAAAQLGINPEKLQELINLFAEIRGIGAENIEQLELK